MQDGICADRNEGLGTLYERFILHGYFESLIRKYRVSSVLECPSFGMSGISNINSLYFASRGIQVTVADNSRERINAAAAIWKELGLKAAFIRQENFNKLPFEDQSFDLVWNFAALWHTAGAPPLMRELERVCRKCLFINVPNRRQVGYLMRKIFDAGYFKTVNEENIQEKKIGAILSGAKSFRVAEKGFYDVPPWPDIAMKKEEFLKKVPVLNKLAGRQQGRGKTDPGNNYIEFFKGNKGVEANIMRYSFLERTRLLPAFMKKAWAHHIYWVLERVGEVPDRT